MERLPTIFDFIPNISSKRTTDPWSSATAAEYVLCICAIERECPGAFLMRYSRHRPKVSFHDRVGSLTGRIRRYREAVFVTTTK